MPGRVMTLGRSWCSRSMAKSTTIAQTKISRAASSGPTGVTATVTAKSRPVTSSTSGYCTEIGARQRAHRPRRTSQLSTGTFSNQRSSRPQLPQADGGNTTDLPRGSLKLTTFRKLPMTRPKRPAMIQAPGPAVISGLQSSAAATAARRRRARFDRRGRAHTAHRRDRRGCRAARRQRRPPATSPARGRAAAAACATRAAQPVDLVERAQLQQTDLGGAAQPVHVGGIAQFAPQRAGGVAIAADEQRGAGQGAEPVGRAGHLAGLVEVPAGRRVVLQPPEVHEADVVRVLPALGSMAPALLEQGEPEVGPARARRGRPRSGRSRRAVPPRRNWDRAWWSCRAADTAATTARPGCRRPVGPAPAVRPRRGPPRGSNRGRRRCRRRRGPSGAPARATAPTSIGGASGAGGETRSRSICSPITAASNRPIASQGTAGRDAAASDVALT